MLNISRLQHTLIARIGEMPASTSTDGDAMNSAVQHRNTDIIPNPKLELQIVLGST
jgi:hypothetical protein